LDVLQQVPPALHVPSQQSLGLAHALPVTTQQIVLAPDCLQSLPAQHP
jgi:hypothetical protein